MTNLSKVHVGIIPDGNRRWSTLHDCNILEVLPLLRERIMHTRNDTLYKHIGIIKELSIYLLSKDNLIKRNDNTLYLIRRAIETIIDDIQDVNRGGVIKEMTKIQFVGELYLLDQDIQDQCQLIEAATRNGSFIVTIALAYDPFDDCRKIVQKEDRPEQSDIDIVIRSGGEKRSSGFFPLHTLYSEWYYSSKLFPDITINDIDDALEYYLSRQRRFGA
jgi:undecaprenyl diphosphate synthase